MTGSAVIHLHRSGPLLALVGNPNCGKTALFNLLTGSRQKVANYAGVTVERKEGRLQIAGGRAWRVLDLPGAYSLNPRSPEERVTADLLFGRACGERRPDLVLCVVDATRLRRQLRLVLAVRRLGLPCVVVLNMVDLAQQRGLRVEADALSAALALPVVTTVGVRSNGADALRRLLDDPATARLAVAAARSGPADKAGSQEADHQAIGRILQQLGLGEEQPPVVSDRIDRVVLHPLAGPLLLAAVLFLVFQAVFSWAEGPQAMIQAGCDAVGRFVGGALPAGPWRSLLIDGLIAGVGGVLVFLPQILILFFFILVLEESGYLPRAAFLLDRLMGGAGLSGRSFIPLLSCFACAVPGVMAARTIADPRQRLVTILVAPLMTCSARLPVYTLLIAAFIPPCRVGGLFELQGLVLSGLYLLGIVGALLVAALLQRLAPAGGGPRSLMMELPDYHWPAPRDVALGLWQRALIFGRRVGTVILTLNVALWLLASFPAAAPDAGGAAIRHSAAGWIGRGLEPLLAPLGFNWQIAVALVPGMAAREVFVGALGTVLSLSAGSETVAQALPPLLHQQWSLATGLALLAWFVFAPQCLATLAAVRRETAGWRAPLLMLAYLFALAWLAAFLTHHLAAALGG